MTDAEPPREELPRPKMRLPFEPIQSPLSGQSGKVFLFAVLAIVCAAAAAYMALVERLPWTDMRVVGPAIGALWFGLRVFMSLTPKV
jgi:hypothetical protein